MLTESQLWAASDDVSLVLREHGYRLYIQTMMDGSNQYVWIMGNIVLDGPIS